MIIFNYMVFQVPHEEPEGIILVVIQATISSPKPLPDGLPSKFTCDLDFSRAMVWGCFFLSPTGSESHGKMWVGGGGEGAFISGINTGICVHITRINGHLGSP